MTRKSLLILVLLLLFTFPALAQPTPLPVINHQLILPDPVASYGTVANRTDYGISVSASGDFMAVGSYWEDVTEDDFVGAVYVYQYVNGAWTLHTRLRNPVPSDNNKLVRYGQEVALDGTTLAVIAENTVYLYELIADVWTEQASFTKTYFLAYAALRNEVLVVGDYGSSVYIYRRVSGVWQEDTPLTANLPEIEQFGAAVALTDDAATLFVGAPLVDAMGGNVYAYTFDGTAWQLETTFASLTAGTYGASLSVYGAGDLVTLAIGAPANSPGTFSINGSVYLQQRVTGIWNSVVSINDPIPVYAVGYGQFGKQVRLIGHDKLVISSLISGSSSLDLLPARFYVYDTIDQQLAEIISPRSLDADGDGRNDYDGFGEQLQTTGTGDALQIIVSARSSLDFGTGKLYVFSHDPDAQELVQAGDFETPPTRALILDSWNRTPYVLRVCADKGADSLCGLRFESGVRSAAWQRVYTDVVPGDALLLQADVLVRREAVLRLKLEVYYTDGFTRTVTVRVRNTNGLYKRVLSAPGLFIADRPIKKIVVRMEHNVGRGIARVDNVSLVKVAGN